MVRYLLFDHMAYFLVHSLAHSVYFLMSVLYSLAISGTRGSSGLGSQSIEQMDNNTCIWRKIENWYKAQEEYL